MRDRRKMVLGVDVDLTVVDSLAPWLAWFKDKTGLEVKNESKTYYLENEMSDLIFESGAPYFSPFSFWEQPDLYDNLSPLEGSVESLNIIKDLGWDIVFISSCVPAHTKSKINFLKKHFKFEHSFIATHDKHLVKYNLLVDDKLEHMIAGIDYCDYSSDHLLFAGVRQDGTDEQVRNACVDVANNWTEVVEYIKYKE